MEAESSMAPIPVSYSLMRENMYAAWCSKCVDKRRQTPREAIDVESSVKTGLNDPVGSFSTAAGTGQGQCNPTCMTRKPDLEYVTYPGVHLRPITANRVPA